ncbi:hypothetical protein KP509_29G060200 [Ceratopteris richardii]|nr:hypothetical protein KP509_29G060200 [Ceratopteris richardii]
MILPTKDIQLISAEPEKDDAEDDQPSQNCSPKSISITYSSDLDMLTQLKDCTKQKDFIRGQELHSEIWRKGGFGKNIRVDNALMHMYVKCGALMNAQYVFDELPLRDVISWTTLIAGYVQHEQGEEAFNLLEQMQAECLAPDVMTLACILKACGSIEAIEKGRKIHSELVIKGFLFADDVIGNALLDMYMKCHAIEDAQDVFNKLTSRSVVTWTSLIQGYCHEGQGEKALKCYEQMQCEGFSPNTLTSSFALKACGKLKATEKGMQIHLDIIKKGLLEENIMIGAVLVGMYAKIGSMIEARQVFRGLSVWDTSSWSALIEGYCQHGYIDEAFSCLQEMHNDRVTLDVAAFSCLLQACSSNGVIENCEILHAQVLREGSLGAFGNGLIDMYVKLNLLKKAQLVLEALPWPDIVSWTALISGYVKHGHAEHALHYFERMQGQGFTVDSVMLSCILKACASIAAAEKGIELHTEIMRKGLLETNIVLGNALIDLYAKCGETVKAQEVFDRLVTRDLVSWNTLIAGYAQNWQGEAALACLEKMQQEGLSPDEATLSCIVKACSTMGAVEIGQAIHAEVSRQGLLEKNVFIGNILVDMYSKCGAIRKAQEVFDQLPDKEVVTWTSIIEGYCHCDLNEQALHCFEQMLSTGIPPTAVTFLPALCACGNLGALEKGEELHKKTIRDGFLEGNSALGSALVDMYAKCGAPQKAQQVFDDLSVRNVVTWTALMAGYGQVGMHSTVFELFNKMLLEGTGPNSITFVVLLNSCCRLNKIDEGELYFKAMKARYGIDATSEHCTCMVNLFSSAGLFDKAVSVIEKMPSDCFPAWFTLLCACQKWGNVQFGKIAFEEVIRLDKEFDLAYMCMSDIYATACMEEEASRVESMRIRTVPGTKGILACTS